MLHNTHRSKKPKSIIKRLLRLLTIRNRSPKDLSMMNPYELDGLVLNAIKEDEIRQFEDKDKMYN
jgi:hypothetical protein